MARRARWLLATGMLIGAVALATIAADATTSAPGPTAAAALVVR